MSKTKVLKELTDQDLIDLVENEIPFATTSNDLILSFTLAFKLEEGPYKVQSKTLYKLFSLWNPHHGYNQASFSKELINYIPFKYSSFNINIHPNNIGLAIEKNKTTRNLTKSKHYHTHFTIFLEKTNIKPGKVFVENDIFYYLYNRWCDENRKKPMASEVFDAICTLYFEKKNTFMSNDYNFFGVNEEIKSMVTKEEVSNWRNGRIRRAKVKNKESKEDGYKIKSGEQIVLYEEKEEQKTKK